MGSVAFGCLAALACLGENGKIEDRWDENDNEPRKNYVQGTETIGYDN